MNETPTTNEYSIAEAKDQLPRLIRDAERDAAVTLTRRGHPVAVIVSAAEYRRLTSGGRDLWEAIEAWRSSVHLAELRVDEVFAGLRDPSPGREVNL